MKRSNKWRFYQIFRMSSPAAQM